MIQVTKGEECPDCLLLFDDGSEKSIKDFLGMNIVLYFYPKDDTPGCTQEAKDFRDNMEMFKTLNTLVIGLSKDNLVKHKEFKNKHNLSFMLASDHNGSVCEKFGVWIEKSMYGKKYFGIERSTFLIDKSGYISNIWRRVSVPGHVTEVIEAIKSL